MLRLAYFKFEQLFYYHIVSVRWLDVHKSSDYVSCCERSQKQIWTLPHDGDYIGVSSLLFASVFTKRNRMLKPLCNFKWQEQILDY